MVSMIAIVSVMAFARALRASVQRYFISADNRRLKSESSLVDRCDDCKASASAFG
jgi:hypothetical protein